jgi:glycosyltransferase involved in cell wall biosynthesis
MIRIVVPAHNEEQRLPGALQSINDAIACAGWSDVEVVVVDDRSTDDTAAIARRFGATVIATATPGKVAALQAGVDHGAAPSFIVAVDADVVVGARTLRDLVHRLQTDAHAHAACPPLLPERRRWTTPLAWALYRYNATRGFSRDRLWMNGRCFVVRSLRFPTAPDIAHRASAARAPHCGDPLRVDDIWLSRSLLQHGEDAIAHVDTDAVYYRAPQTLRGMLQTWTRLQRELRRIDTLFPELPRPRSRRIDMRGRPASDFIALWIFQVALIACRTYARVDNKSDEDAWPIVAESKSK